MPLDEQAKKLLDEARKNGLPPMYMLSLDEARKKAHENLPNSEEIVVGNVENIVIPRPWGDMACRVYTPGGGSLLPIFVFFHGGGWTIESIDTHDTVCRHIAKLSDCVVVSVDYRLAPETKYPGGIEDVYAATEWVYENAVSLKGDSDRIAVGGDSSGGNMAAVVCLMARDRKGPEIKYQVLIYPVTDHFPDNQSHRDFATGYSLDRDYMTWFWNYYLNPEDSLDDPYICPLRAKSLENLPPAHIQTAEYDPLRDEGEAYAKRLKEAGVEVDLTRYDGMFHGYAQRWHLLDKGMTAIVEISSKLKKHM